MSATTLISYSRRLDRDWQFLRTRRVSLICARAWDLTPPGIALDDLRWFIDATQRSGGREADRLLGRLVSVAHHDDLAARIVVQRLLPGLVVQSRRHRFRCDGVEPLDLVVPSAWMAVKRFDVRRRSTHIAASLRSDAIHLAFRQPSRRVSRSDVVEPSDFDKRPAATTLGAFEELASAVALARRRGVADEHLELVRHLVRAGSPTQVALERGVTARTVRNHRDVAIRRIRAAVAA